MGLLTAYAFQQRADAKEKAQLAAIAQAQAQGNAEQAKAEQKKSEQARDQANRARRSEATQRRIADRQRDRAEEEAGRANTEAGRAKTQATRAKNEARRADVQRDIAVRARAEAVASKDSAVRSRHEAVASKNEAVASKNEAVKQRDAARDAKANEQTARKQAEAREDVATALSLLGVDPEQSLQLALGSAEVGQSAQLENALRDGLIATRSKRILPGGGGAVGPTAVSSDGALVVVPSSSGVAEVYEVESGKRLSTIRHGAPINDVAFAPAPASFLTAGRNRVVQAADSSLFVTGGRDG